MGGPILSDEPASIHSEPSRPPELFCPECGYSLQGIGSERCPECGQAIDWTTVGESRIPWVHRKQIGRWRAYWRTAWWASGRLGQLAREIQWPVRYADARRFQLVTAVVSGVSLALMTALVYADAPNIPSPLAIGFPAGAPFHGIFNLLLPLAAAALLYVVFPLCCVLLMLMVTGVGSYLFHPRRLTVVQQNRAVALSLYACAPLAYLPVVAALLGAMLLAILIGDHIGSEDAHFYVASLLGIMMFAAVLFIGFAWWWGTVRLYQRVTHAGAAVTLLASMLLPAMWVVCALFALVAVPWVIGFVALVIASFA